MMGELGTYTATRVRRTDGDCGASSNRSNGSIMPAAVRRRVCDTGMLNTAGMLFIFINNPNLPDANTCEGACTHARAWK